MAATLLLQTSRWRDVAYDAALIATAEALDPIRVIAATAEPERTERATGLRTVPAQPAALLRALPLVDSVVVLGGSPISSQAAKAHLFGLGELYALLSTFNVAGRRIALVGVGAATLSTRRDAFYARRLVTKSSFTVFDTTFSMQQVTAAGVPSPLRMAAQLEWLQLQDPVQPGTGTAEICCPLTRLDIEAYGGAAATADTLAAIRAEVVSQSGTDTSVTVQAWRRGLYAGDDLESAAEVVAALGRLGVRSQVASPPPSLSGARERLAGVQLCVCADQHTMMTAAAAGAPLLSWPHDPAGMAAATRLEVPILTRELRSCVAAALGRSGLALSSVRQAIAAAGETADLLKVLLSQGSEPPRLQNTPRPEQFSGLRPIGVMK